VENQQKQLNFLRQINAASTANVPSQIIEDVHPHKMDTEEKLQELNKLLMSSENNKKLVSCNVAV
jgi:hypothetical protein